MGGTVLKWGLPALVTVVGGTLAAVALAGPAIPATLADRAHVLLRDGSITWASVSFDMQDAVVAGQAPSIGAAEELLAEISAIPGVRTVTSELTIATPVAAGPFVATVADGVVTLSGTVPDEAARALLVAEAGEGAVDRLEVVGPITDRDTWLRAADFTLSQAARLAEGEVAYTDNTLTLSGRARSADDLVALSRLAEAAPGGVKTGFTEIAPPVQSPYGFTASFDGKRLILNGFVPDLKLAESLAALAPTGVTVETALSPASGAPEGFAEDAAALVRNLLTLERGQGGITDTKISLDGTASDAARADALSAELTRRGVAGTIESATAAILDLTLAKADGKLTVKGAVADKASETQLSALPDVTIAALTVNPRGPTTFAGAVSAAIAIADRLTDGQVVIRGNAITASGRVRSEADLVALRSQPAPGGFSLALDKLQLPLVVPYTFSAELGVSGLTLSGNVPNDAVRRALMVPGRSGKLALADGAPSSFAGDASAAVDLLGRLKSGSLRFDGKAWLLSGEAATAEAGAALRSAFASSPIAKAGTLDITVPAPAIANIAPYVFTAERTGDGLLITGYVPDAATRTALLAGLSGTIVDRTQLGAGAPADFATLARAALLAVAEFDKGSAGLKGTEWTVSGTVATGAEKQVLEASLQKVATPRWSIAIQAADAPPLVSPFLWSAEKAEDGAIRLSGYVPDAEMRKALAAIAGTMATDDMLVGSGEPDKFAERARASLSALVALKTGKVAFDGTTWSLSGQPADGDGLEAARAAVASLGSAIAVTLSPPPAAAAPDPQPVADAAEPTAEPVPAPAAADPTSEPAAPETAAEPATSVASAAEPAATAPAAEAAEATGPAPVAEPEQQLAAVDPNAVVPPPAEPVTPPIEICQSTIGRLAERNAIVFASGEAVLLKESAAALDELAADLAACPKVIVNVEGHTDSDGEADANLALSVARAEAVVDQLINRGISAQRLYAVGYGESLPIAPNDTKAGKQANRRIAFTLAEQP